MLSKSCLQQSQKLLKYMHTTVQNPPAIALERILDGNDPRANNFRRNVSATERYLQLSDWKSGTNCSSSGTWAGREISVLDLCILLKGTAECFTWGTAQSRNLPSANQASWSWLRSWNNSVIKKKKIQNEDPAWAKEKHSTGHSTPAIRGRSHGSQGRLHYLQNREPDPCPKTSSFCQSQVVLDIPLTEISERGQQMKIQMQERRWVEVRPLLQEEEDPHKEIKNTMAKMPTHPWDHKRDLLITKPIHGASKVSGTTVKGFSIE